jgi:hypothetical protein
MSLRDLETLDHTLEDFNDACASCGATLDIDGCPWCDTDGVVEHESLEVLREREAADR